MALPLLPVLVMPEMPGRMPLYRWIYLSRICFRSHKAAAAATSAAAAVVVAVSVAVVAAAVCKSLEVVLPNL